MAMTHDCGGCGTVTDIQPLVSRGDSVAHLELECSRCGGPCCPACAEKVTEEGVVTYVCPVCQ